MFDDRSLLAEISLESLPQELVSKWTCVSSTSNNVVEFSELHVES